MFKKNIVVLCLFFILHTSVAKPLYIEIPRGQNVGIPITVLPFKNNAGQSIAGVTDISHIISKDLSSSGQFRLVESSALERISDNKFWRRLGTEHVIHGTVEKVGKLYTIEILLRSIKNDGYEDKVHQRFTDINEEEFRLLSHKLSDIIFEQLTGIKGIFSTRIAYITIEKIKDLTKHTLTVADADGYNDKPLVESIYPLMSPAWSPDSKKLAYVTFYGNKAAIKVVDVDTARTQLLTQSPGINSAPAWSNDGKRLAVVLSKDGAPKIYILELDSKKLRRVTHGGNIDTEPKWMPGDKSIVFTSNRGGSPQIYQLDLETEKVERITFEGKYNTTPSITKDGKNIVMLHKGDSGKYNVAVYFMNTGKVRIITDNKYDESPSLAPNGMMVLYGTMIDGHYSLRAVSLDGKFHMNLPAHGVHVKEPVWSGFLS
ncbi:MAG: Tol-Pal system beta propeller repeat protein TolB [Francisellaceae bacterium]|jgi:TolB protein|nr:Tol-Pal system beta propeller repeat protein TolB [Francisellaceae bacterium]MBT6207606.1 Tol-Pal system beta propeller repeat protein TolB [Francisellaceae bacterium]MBT6538100.1 Tol-Pal system beta propeller repeat protein TolB [Francisellaceae bacterium]